MRGHNGARVVVVERYYGLLALVGWLQLARHVMVLIIVDVGAAHAGS